MKRVLLITDMLKSFCEQGRALYCGESVRDIIPFVVKKAREFREAGDRIIFIADRHDPDDVEFKLFPKHCVKGTEDGDVIPELQEFVNDADIVAKTRYGSFYGTRLDDLLSQIGPDEVHIVGVCTNICVFFTVEELHNRNYKTVVYRDGVTSFDLEAHEFALKQMASVLGAEVK